MLDTELAATFLAEAKGNVSRIVLFSQELDERNRKKEQADEMRTGGSLRTSYKSSSSSSGFRETTFYRVYANELLLEHFQRVSQLIVQRLCLFGRLFLSVIRSCIYRKSIESRRPGAIVRDSLKSRRDTFV